MMRSFVSICDWTMAWGELQEFSFFFQLKVGNFDSESYLFFGKCQRVLKQGI